LKEQMTSLDVAAAVRELKELIVGAVVDNVYQARAGPILLRLRRPGEALTLIGAALGRVGLTWAEYSKPSSPPSFCALLRRRLRGGRVAGVEQLNRDRLVALDVARAGSTWRLVFELVRGFNALLLEGGVVVGCLRPKRMKDRALIPGASYSPPPSRGLDPFTCSPGEFIEGLRRAGGKLASALVRAFNLSREEVEEACFKAGLSKELKASEVDVEAARRLQTCIQELRERAERGELKPHIVYLDGEPVTALPFDLASVEGRKEYFPSFNQALDSYFTWLRGKVEEEKAKEEAERAWERAERVRRLQQAKLEELRKAAAEMREEAEVIMASLPLAQRAVEAVKQALARGVRGEGLLEEARKLAPEVVDVDPASRNVHVKLGGRVVTLNFSTSAAQHASRLYEEAKEAERKARRVEEALKRAAQEAVGAGSEALRAKLSFKRRAWYEKFRWFYTSGGFLVVGGRDSLQNERLVDRYLEEADVFIHADIYGAPAVVVKLGGKAGEDDLREACQFAVAYSRAWSEGRLQGDAYWVKPSQVSKEAPSGEYLSRGAFMVRGERDYVRGLPMEAAIGVDGEGRVIGGPTSAVAKRAKAYVVLAPGQAPPSTLAKEVAARLALPPSEVDEVARFMPPGPSRIIRVVGCR
jgi:predicted ribosome quality control (RQC) complex YloA/Tae2 family protein